MTAPAPRNHPAEDEPGRTHRDVDPRVKPLRDALADMASRPGELQAADLAGVAAAAGLHLSAGAFDAALKQFRRLPFYGGNFTLDAKRLLKAIDTAEDPS